jgi:hypothetical protein
VLLRPFSSASSAAKSGPVMWPVRAYAFVIEQTRSSVTGCKLKFLVSIARAYTPSNLLGLSVTTAIMAGVTQETSDVKSPSSLSLPTVVVVNDVDRNDDIDSVDPGERTCCMCTACTSCN